MADATNASPSVLGVGTPQQISQQATKMVSQEYKPVISSIQDEEQQAAGLADKRTADNQSYQSWLTSQSDALETNSRTQTAGLTNLLGQVQTAQSSLYGGNAAAAMTQQANARMGNVSNNADSNVLGTNASSGNPSYLASAQQSAAGLTDAATQQGASNALVNNGLLQAGISNNSAIIGNNEKLNEADLSTTMTKLQDTLSTDAQKEQGDATTQYNDLLKDNQSVAENNRDYAATLAMDGVKATTATNENTARTATTSRDNANTASEIATRAATTNDTNLKTQATLAHTSVEDTLARKTFAVKYGLSTDGTGQLTGASLNAARAKINALAGTVNELLTSAYIPGAKGPVKASAGALRTLWLNGGPYYTLNQATGKYEVHSIKGNAADDGIAWSAFATSNAGQGLSNWDVNALKTYGITNLTGYKTAQKATTKGTK